MRVAAPVELPPEQERHLQRIWRVEVFTVVYVSSAAFFLYVTMGSSQVMRTSFFEDLVSMVPAITFLICARLARRKPSTEFPYGWHGVVSIGYLVSSLALVGMGLFLITEAALKFLHAERTTIGGFEIFGEVVWAGWLMLAAVAYTGVPTFFLGRLKMKLAQPVHDKIIYADARMMHADWLTESATAIGVLGAGLGVWWIDPLAAALISLDILRDGVVNLSIAFGDLMERRPLKTDRTAPEPLPEQIRARIQSLEWVNRAEVRLRDVGHVVFGEVFVEPRGTPPDLPAKIAAAAALAKSLSWRIHDVTITVLPRLGGPESTTGIDRAKAQ